MIRHFACRLAVGCLFLFCALLSLMAQQPATGLPPLGSFSSGVFDTVNLANLDVHLSIPIFSRPGKGIPFDYALTYDSLIWVPTASGSTTSWQPVSNWGWRTATEAATGWVEATPDDGTCQINYSLLYHDPSGGIHPFNGHLIHIVYSQIDGCPGPNQWIDDVNDKATDNSGYILTTHGLFSAPTVNARGGLTITPPRPNLSLGSGSVADANGNTITTNYNATTQVTTIYDTLNATTAVLTISGIPPNNAPTCTNQTGTSSVKYTYTAPNNNSVYFNVSYAHYEVQTNFGQGIGEFGDHAECLVNSITLPDNTYYQFHYETTIGNGINGKVTGRLASITLPTGGTISYLYGSGTCNNNTSNSMMKDGSPASMSKTSTGVASPSVNISTSYTRQLNPNGNGNQQFTQTNVEDGYGNWTYLNFNGIYETQRLAYEGTSSGTILKHTNTCYNQIYSGCDTSTQITAPITQKDYDDYMNSTGFGTHLWSDYQYNSDGLLTTETDHDYGNGTWPTLRTTTINYNTSLCTSYNICDHPSSVEIKDGSGNRLVYTTYAYDGNGSPTHGSVSTISRWISGTSYLTTQYKYNSAGTLNYVQDPNLTYTTYSYDGTCNSAFPTSITAASTLTTTYHYNCTGGVVTSITDSNNNTSTSINYSDPYFWRPASSTDAANNTTTYSYLSPNQTESVMTFNSGGSASDVLATLDALGRPVLNQVRQAPGSSNWDTTENIYDGSGRISFVNLPFVDTAGAIQGSLPSVGYFYDGLGRYTSTSRWDGVNELSHTDYTYNLNDVKMTVNPAPTQSRQMEYDAIGRLTSVCEITSASDHGTCTQQSGQNGYFTQYAYNVNSMSVNQSGQTRSYSYDGIGRLTQEINPESGTTSYAYDSIGASSCSGSASSSPGDMVYRLDQAGTSTCYYYDGLHRLTAAGQGGEGSNAICRRFSYDNSNGYKGTIPPGISPMYKYGRLVEAATDSCGTQSDPLITDEWFSYSPRGELTDLWESTPHSSQYYHTQAAYWANGTLNTLNPNLSGIPNLTYKPDGEGRTSSVTASSGQSPLASAAYAVASPPGTGASTTVTYGSGDSDVFGYYYNTGFLNKITYNVGSQVVTNTLGWSYNGTLTSSSVNDPLNTTTPQQNCTYNYDDLGRLFTTSGGPSAVRCLDGNQATIWYQDIRYDKFGNLNKFAGNQMWNPNYDTANNNRYQNGWNGITYDANGNLTFDTFNTYTWDPNWGNPATVNTNALVYDALGRMVENTITAGTREYIYGPVGTQPLTQMNGSTPVTVQYPLPGGGMAMYNSSAALTYAHADWLGSVRLVTNSSQQMVNDSAYAPFGEQWAVKNIGFSGFYSFTGQQQWTVSGVTAGLDDFLFRRYHPVQGRWITPDPAGLAAVNMTNPQMWNRYAYVMNSPLAYVDPFGLYLCETDDETGQTICDGNGIGAGGGGFGGVGQPGQPDPGVPTCGTGDCPPSPFPPYQSTVWGMPPANYTGNFQPGTTCVNGVCWPSWPLLNVDLWHLSGGRGNSVSVNPNPTKPQGCQPGQKCTPEYFQCANSVAAKATLIGLNQAVVGASGQIKQALQYFSNNRAAFGAISAVGIGGYYAVSASTSVLIGEAVAAVGEYALPIYGLYRLYVGSQAAQAYADQNGSHCDQL
jgi:RHS repeat-associated protein